MFLINIGFGNYVSSTRIVAVVDPESNPIKRIIAQAKESGRLIDATYGRKTKSVIMTDSGHVVLSQLTPDGVRDRTAGKTGEENTIEP